MPSAWALASARPPGAGPAERSGKSVVSSVTLPYQDVLLIILALYVLLVFLLMIALMMQKN
ncbi:hypothetical protein [Paenibacillus beijingensis]|uniref:Uncharacterized protein n=1 Tax=Paenibacillus beijingensis TaxID=1126833 RepID=A0A0D5NMV1_9BACL|nr:hypothetical protein [Paenibacillus beijingensis]AJY76243.1 hypothetical protein VN24_18850 [Paenibacillus beijingensis]